ncbi:sorbosone dehydrogenase family protein [Litoribacter alkaliphilus]|uniref:Sorbosone dehydrogenase family protein n=1 Tax=Litoribacter ruber TaxID=702568 RepID=A0AAP2CJL2_9BACT|nr:sorbosone dehydrogenase family protein [Litoribacter alkaliphilus]MBS9525115.1 sorbosone dehydrogenase family protein [Litoribacter alkaliphilus]
MIKPKLWLASLLIAGVAVSCDSPQKSTRVTADEGDNRVTITDAEAEVYLDKIKLPENFKIEVWAADVPNARSLAKSDNGVIFVGNRQGDKVFALLDEDGDGKADYRYTLAEDLNMPNGVAFKNGDLYVAEVSRVLRFRDIENTLANPSFEVLFDQYPTDKHHGWKFIAFGPDDKLYIPVGAPCNICNPEKEIYASITRIDVDAENIEPEVFAHGVRNTVGFDWHPESEELWFTDNGRDMMGDDIPDCELNHAPQKGMHFGYPFWHAGDVKDPEFGSEGKGKEDYTKPKVNLGAHVAPLGMRFYTGDMFPSEFNNTIFLAKHGSWNRSKKVGYNVTTVSLNGTDQIDSHEVFAEGWLDDATQEVWGRPVDVLQLEDGSLLVSDDMANCIYRISYQN